MAARKAEVVYVGDAASLIRASREAATAVGRTHNEIQAFAGKTEKSMGRIKAAVRGLGAVTGLSALAFGLKDITSEAVKAEAEQKKLANTVKDAGISWNAHSKQIDEWLNKTSLASGFLKSDLTASFGNMVRTTGSLTKAQHLNAIAMDVARSKGVGLANAQSIIARAYNGSYRGLQRLGIQVVPVTKAQDLHRASTKHATEEQKRHAKQLDATATRTAALGLLMQKFGGQTQAYASSTAGSFQRAHAAIALAQETLGKALLPTLAKAATAIATFAAGMANGTGEGGKFAATMKSVWQDLHPVLSAIKAITGFLIQNPRLLAAAAAAFVAWKVAAAAAAFQAKAKLIATFLGLAPKAAAGGAEAGAAFGNAAGTAASGELRAMKWGGLGRFAGLTFAAGFVVAALPTIDKLTGGPLSGNDVVTPTKRSLFNLKNDPHGINGPGMGNGTRFPKLTSTPNFHIARGANFSVGQEPTIAARLGRLAQATGAHLTGLSGYRTPKHSVAVGGFANDPHTRGIAADVPGLENIPESVLRRFGLTRPFPGAKEADHVQLLPGFTSGLSGLSGVKFRGGSRTLTPNEIRGVAYNAGFRGKALDTAVAIARAESGGRTGAINHNSDGSTDRGLFQINSVHGKASTFNVQKNAAAAFRLFKARGGFGDWSTFVNGAYKHFLSDVGSGTGSRMSGGLPTGSGSLAQAIRSLKVFQKEAAKARKEAKIKIEIANIGKVHAFQAAVQRLAGTLKQAASDAADKWQAAQDKMIDTSSPQALELASLQSIDKQKQDAATEKQLNQDLADAIASGDKNAIQDAQDAIDAYKRQKREDQLAAEIQAAHDSAADQRDKMKDGLDKQFADLLANLANRKIAWQQFATEVNGILSANGLPAMDVSPADQQSLIGGPGPLGGSYGATGGSYVPTKLDPSKVVLYDANGKPVGFAAAPAAGWTYDVSSAGQVTGLHHRAAGGRVARGQSYMVGEVGAERFTPTVDGRITPASQSRGSGATVVMENVTITSGRAAQRVADRLAFRLKYG